MVKIPVADPFIKSNLWINSLKVYTVFFVCQIDCYRHILKLSCRPFLFTSCKGGTIFCPDIFIM